MLVGLKSCAQPWPDVTSLSLGTNCFISPLAAKIAAKTIAIIHSARFIQTA
jgi:hypothetical protein